MSRRGTLDLVPVDFKPKASPNYKITPDEYMPNSTIINKEKDLLLSEDPAHLERTICKDQRSTLLDAAAFTSADSRTQPPTDTRPSSQDENGNLYDQDGHLCNAESQKLDAQGNEVCSAEGEEAVDMQGEEEVNYIGGIGFQRSRNKGGNKTFYGNGQRGNQSSQFQKSFSNNNRGYGNSFYRIPPPQTHESKIEALLDRVLEGQQQLTVDFNGKIDSAYNSLNTRIKTLGTQVRKLEMQVVQTGDTLRRQEALAREAGVEKAKHHVNAIINDDFWQVVKHEKLGEGDFEVERSMSFGGSHLCRPMSMDTHRSIDHDEDRSTDHSEHRST
ncbi:hypothetical protein F2Q69_00023642 [Brassica cretica]|uniref:Uncharacterized protein n=1 Tax=Brassica cretica TaxID=69181 RepID=A0A8S9Q7P3_BRACR|nr:hypothetical protein F2Q69_00023642 [Brassica cretica]